MVYGDYDDYVDCIFDYLRGENQKCRVIESVIGEMQCWATFEQPADKEKQQALRQNEFERQLKRMNSNQLKNGIISSC